MGGYGTTMKWIIATISLFYIVGCEQIGCNGAGPSPSPSPVPTPIPPLGTVVLSFPSAIPGSLGSIDFKGEYIVEYCRGAAKLFWRNPLTGEVVKELALDPKLNKLWAVCWDEGRQMYGATNPDLAGYPQNIIKIGQDGKYLGGARMPADTSKPALVLHDIVANGSYVPNDPDGDAVAANDWNTSDDHYSLRKCDHINPDTYREEFWWKYTISHWGQTRVGNKFWAACSKNNPVKGEYPIYEFNEGQHRQFTTATGRWILVLGACFTSLKTDPNGRFIWGKSNLGISKISLGI